MEEVGEIDEFRGFCDDCLMDLCTWNHRIVEERNEAFPAFPEIAQVYSEAAWDRINSQISLENIMQGFMGIKNVVQRETLFDVWALLMMGHYWRSITEGQRQTTIKERMTLIEMRRTLELIALSDLESILPENQDRRAELLLRKVEISSLKEDEKECSICSRAFG